jgi:transposase InsO family protein
MRHTLETTKRKGQSYIWWPHIGVHIENFTMLQLASRSTKDQYDWERIHVDFLGPMDGNYFFVLIDAYSKRPEVFKMKDIRTEPTINKLRKTFARYGLPRTIVSDNGLQFTKQEFEKYVERHQIKHLKTPLYHPQSNEQAENCVKTFKQALKGNITENNNTEKNCSWLGFCWATGTLFMPRQKCVLLNCSWAEN